MQLKGGVGAEAEEVRGALVRGYTRARLERLRAVLAELGAAEKTEL